MLFSRPPSYESLQTGSETSNENKLLTDVLKQNIYTQIHKHKYLISPQSFVFVSTLFARILKVRLYAQVITKLFTQHFPPQFLTHTYTHLKRTLCLHCRSWRLVSSHLRQVPVVGSGSGETDQDHCRGHTGTLRQL